MQRANVPHGIKSIDDYYYHYYLITQPELSDWKLDYLVSVTGPKLFKHIGITVECSFKCQVPHFAICKMSDDR